MYRKILLGIDGSEESNKAVKKAVELQKDFKCTVIIFHSVKHHYIPHLVPLTFPIGVNYPFMVTDDDVENMRESYKTAGERILADAKDLFIKEGLIVETRLDIEESPEDYIKRIVPEENFDLIILGYQGHHSKLRNAIMGSLPEKVLNDLDVDLLIVK